MNKKTIKLFILELFIVISFLLINNQIINAQRFHFRDSNLPSYDEMNHLKQKIDHLDSIKTQSRDPQADNIINEFRKRYAVIERLVQMRNARPARDEYNKLLGEVEATTQRWKQPIVNPPSYTEMNELKNKINQARNLAIQKRTNTFDQRINNIQFQFSNIENLIRQNRNEEARNAYNTANAEIDNIIRELTAFVPAVLPPDANEMNVLQNKVNQAKNLVNLKRAIQFNQRISNVENKINQINTYISRNRNMSAREVYNQAISEIDQIIIELTAYQPPKERIRRSQTVADRPAIVSSITTYTKNVSGTSIKAFEFATFRFDIDLSRSVRNAELRFSGFTNISHPKFRVRIKINNRIIPVSRPTLSTQRSTWIVSIPQNLLVNGRNNIRFIVSRPKKQDNFYVNLDEVQLILNH